MERQTGASWSQPKSQQEPARQEDQQLAQDFVEGSELTALKVGEKGRTAECHNKGMADIGWRLPLKRPAVDHQGGQTPEGHAEDQAESPARRRRPQATNGRQYRGDAQPGTDRRQQHVGHVAHARKHHHCATSMASASKNARQISDAVERAGSSSRHNTPTGTHNRRSTSKSYTNSDPPGPRCAEGNQDDLAAAPFAVKLAHIQRQVHGHDGEQQQQYQVDLQQVAQA